MGLNVFFTLSFGVLVGHSAFSATYYMSPNGNDSNSGSKDRPWKSLNRATKTAVAGDLIYLRGGNYYISQTQNLNGNAGTSTKPITYKSYPGEVPTIMTDARSSVLTTTRLGATLLDISEPYQVLDGINFAQTEESRKVAIVNNTATSLYSKASTTAIYLWQSNITVRNCSIQNMSGQGIHVGGGTANVLVENCKITGTGSHGFYIKGKNGIFRRNTLDGSRGYPNQQGVQVQYATAVGNKIYNNLIKNGQASGINFSGKVANNEVFNNVFINAGSGSVAGYPLNFWCEDGPLGAGNRFYNNTVIGKSNGGLIYNGLPTKCNGVKPASRVDVRENIFYPSTAKAIGYVGSNLRNNIFYNVTNSAPSGNKKLNPLLVNPLGTTAASAALKSGSPAINTGLSYTSYPKFDFLNYARPTKFDLGAFEYGAN